MHQDIQSPIIVIGAGRSGSTLISRILNAHGSIDFKGETSFLLLRLWVELWHDRFWLNWPRHVSINPHCASDPMPAMTTAELAAERQRVGRLVARILVDLLQVDQRKYPVWGFKELWSGLAHYNHDWSAYDAVLPGAHWLHLVRHPFSFARSVADWNGAALTRPYLVHMLANWMDMLACNRQRSTTGRYHELRFEDLVRDPALTIGPVLQSLGLCWEAGMGKVLESKTMSSRNAAEGQDTVLVREDAASLVDSIPDLAGVMGSFGYAVPADIPLASAAKDESVLDLRNPDDEDLGHYLPRYALEAQLHQARATVSELSSAVNSLQHDDENPSGPVLQERLNEIQLSVVRLDEILRQ